MNKKMKNLVYYSIKLNYLCPSPLLKRESGWKVDIYWGDYFPPFLPKLNLLYVLI